MNLFVINRTIQEMCAEVVALSEAGLDWRSLTEEQLLHEAAVCMFSSQMVFEVAEAAAKTILEHGLLRRDFLSTKISDYESQLVVVLTKPLTVTSATGKSRQVRPRFKNRLASLLASTIQDIHGRGSSIRDILSLARSSRHAREILIDRVWGFGPKQASLFLRRIGYCSELAVLDTHVLEYLRLALGVDPKPSSLSRLASYERLEAEFQNIASEFGHSVGCVDLATWVTMRVAKRETVLWV
ncbi:hypothetical protein [Geobacter sulfurreducens]|uniref:8-oxoguanine DNA glycosylase n=1 Tax=Geobacter sulfurreducens TaxID=35554 RepID=UPI00117C53E3|nr:hypothetical protein [Geobacter sulfurreducens]